MSTLDYCRSVTVRVAVFAGTLLLSIPMVVGYALLINPGHPPELYRGAATWLAPWSAAGLAGAILGLHRPGTTRMRTAARS